MTSCASRSYSLFGPGFVFQFEPDRGPLAFGWSFSAPTFEVMMMIVLRKSTGGLGCR